MNLKLVLGLAPSVLALTGCGTLADGARQVVGMNDARPVMTERSGGYRSHSSAEALREIQTRAREELDHRIRWVALSCSDEQAECADEDWDIGRSEATSVERGSARRLSQASYAYLSLGRLAMRSQCEDYLQSLGVVDGQMNYGNDLGNIVFDTLTVGATVSHSPVAWVTGLSSFQAAFNSVDGSTQAFLLTSEATGALRVRVLNAMNATLTARETALPSMSEFNAVSNNDRATAIDYARQSIEAVQSYGAACSEGAIRQIVTDALSERTTVRELADGGRGRILHQNLQQELRAYFENPQFILEERDIVSLGALDRAETDAVRTRILTGMREHDGEAHWTHFERISDVSYLPSRRAQIFFYVRDLIAVDGAQGARQIARDALLASARAPQAPIQNSAPATPQSPAPAATDAPPQ